MHAPSFPRRARIWLLAGLALAWAFAAHAHHSNAAYDLQHPVTVQGTVRVVNWTNPHINFHVMTDATGAKPSEEWVFEVSSPGVLTRSGWTKRSLQPGDHAEFRYAPQHDGTAGGFLLQVKKDDGTILAYTLAPTEQ